MTLNFSHQPKDGKISVIVFNKGEGMAKKVASSLHAGGTTLHIRGFTANDLILQISGV